MALEAENIYFRYDRHQPWILENQNLKAEPGERIALTAPSGYGKTTLAMILAGYLTPSIGQVRCDGAVLPEKGFCPVQLIFQHPENAVNPRWRLRRILEENNRIDLFLLRSLGIERAWLDRFPNELSGGELQKFCVARALMSNASYLICDEISTMLDAITQAQIWNVIMKEAGRRNMGIIVITHNMNLAHRVSDRIISLDSDRGCGFLSL